MAGGRLAHDIDHASGNGADDLLVINEQLTVRLTVDRTTNWHVRDDHKRQLTIREWADLHTDQHITNPGSYERFGNTGVVIIPVSPVFAGHNLRPGIVLEGERIDVLSHIVVRLTERGRRTGYRNLVDVLVQVCLLLQFRFAGFKGVDDEACLRQIPIA